MLYIVRQKKTKVGNILTDIIRWFINRNNNNHLQEPMIAPTEFYITIMAKLRILLAGGGPARPNQNADQLNL